MIALAPGSVKRWVWPIRDTPRPWRPPWAVMGPGIVGAPMGCVGVVWPADPDGLPYPCRHRAGHRHRCEPGPR